MLRKILITLIPLSLFFAPATVFAQGLWSKKASLPAGARYDGMSFSIGNYGYVGLGGGSTNIYNDFWQYNPSTNSWGQKAKFPGLARVCPATFVIGHRAYVVTGSDSTSGNFLTECWVYDANTNTWIQKNNFPGAGRTWAFGFAIGNKGFIGTGNRDGVDYYKDFWEYDTTSDTWTRKADFGGTARGGACGFAIGNKGYVCFGQDTVYGIDNDIWQYDTGSNSWTKKTNSPDSGYSGASGFAIGTNIYAGTGIGYGDVCETNFWEYNTLHDAWYKVTDFPGTARTNESTGFSIADSGYIGFGINTTGAPTYFNDFYKFYPDSTTSINSLIPNKARIIISPNPFNTYCVISISDEITTPPIFNLFDIQGRKMVLNISGGNNYYVINRNDLSEGIYILTIQINNEMVNRKLVITNN